MVSSAQKSEAFAALLAGKSWWRGFLAFSLLAFVLPLMPSWVDSFNPVMIFAPTFFAALIAGWLVAPLLGLAFLDVALLALAVALGTMVVDLWAQFVQAKLTFLNNDIRNYSPYEFRFVLGMLGGAIFLAAASYLETRTIVLTAAIFTTLIILRYVIYVYTREHIVLVLLLGYAIAVSFLVAWWQGVKFSLVTFLLTAAVVQGILYLAAMNGLLPVPGVNIYGLFLAWLFILPLITGWLCVRLAMRFNLNFGALRATGGAGKSPPAKSERPNPYLMFLAGVVTTLVILVAAIFIVQSIGTSLNTNFTKVENALKE
jgi:hypothetical protein